MNFDKFSSILPGLCLTFLLAVISIVLSFILGVLMMGFEKSPISAVMIAVLIGLFLNNFVCVPEGFREGVHFSLNNILKLGIILLGIRLGVWQRFLLNPAN